jgi:hypothetical protein
MQGGGLSLLNWKLRMDIHTYAIHSFLLYVRFIRCTCKNWNLLMLMIVIAARLFSKRLTVCN